jgi:hypothetical protein
MIADEVRYRDRLAIIARIANASNVNELSPNDLYVLRYCFDGNYKEIIDRHRVRYARSFTLPLPYTSETERDQTFEHFMTNYGQMVLNGKTIQEIYDQTNETSTLPPPLEHDAQLGLISLKGYTYGFYARKDPLLNLLDASYNDYAAFNVKPLPLRTLLSVLSSEEGCVKVSPTLQQEFNLGVFSPEFQAKVRQFDRSEQQVRRAQQERKRVEQERRVLRQKTKNTILEQTQVQYATKQQLDQPAKILKFKQQAAKFSGRFKANELQEIPDELKQAYIHYLMLTKANAWATPFEPLRGGYSLDLTISAEGIGKPEACFDLIAKQAFDLDLFSGYGKLYVKVIGEKVIDAGGVSRTVFANAGKYIRQFMVENLKSHTYKFRHHVPLAVIENIAIVMTYALYLGMPLGIAFSPGIIYLLLRGISGEAQLMEDNEYLGTLFYLESVNVSNTDPFKNVRKGIEKYYIPELDQMAEFGQESTRETRLFTLKRYLEKDLFYGKAIYSTNPVQAVQMEQKAQELQEQQQMFQQQQGHQQVHRKPVRPTLTPQQTKEKYRKLGLIQEQEGKVDLSKKLTLLYRVFIHGVTICSPPKQENLSIKDVQSRLGVQLTEETMSVIPIRISLGNEQQQSHQQHQQRQNRTAIAYRRYYQDFVKNTKEADWTLFLEFVSGVAFPPSTIIFNIIPLTGTYEDELIHAHTCFSSLDIPNNYPDYSPENSVKFTEKVLQHIRSDDAKLLLNL